MSDMHKSDDVQANVTPEDAMAALFANMVLQQTNMALMFLGKVPHPETGKPVLDLDMAQVFIDQLEMLSVKTKGNLDKREEGLLNQSLTAVRLAFVEAARESAGKEEKKPETSQAAAGETPPSSPSQSEGTTQAAAEADSRKKFSKKY